MHTAENDTIAQQAHDTIVSDNLSWHNSAPLSIFGENDTTADAPSHELFGTDSYLLPAHNDSTAITLREGIDAERLPVSTTDNSWYISILLVVFLFYAISYNRSAKYLRHLFLSLFKNNVRGNLFDETTINENQLKLSLLSITFIAEGTALYYALFESMLTNSNLMLPAILLCSITCGLYYLLQVAVYRVLGNIFSNKQQTEYFIESFTSVNLFIGLFFTPVILAMLFVPQFKIATVIICAILYILSRLIIIYKGISFFSPHIFGLLYIILYLCALEIIPLRLIVKAVENVYRLLELNLITP